MSRRYKPLGLRREVILFLPLAVLLLIIIASFNLLVYRNAIEELEGERLEEAELLASDGSQGDHLGYSVALSGDLALVGAYNECDCWAGEIYVYRFDPSSQTWNEEAKLVGPKAA